MNTLSAWSTMSSFHSSEIMKTADTGVTIKGFHHRSDDMQEGGDWWHTYLVPGSITVVMFPLSIKCIWFPAEGVAGRAEIWQQRQGQEGSSCEHHFHWCAWKRKKSGNAYTIRAGTLSDLIFERGLSRSPQRVLLIHCPGPLCGDRRIIKRRMTKWHGERSLEVPSSWLQEWIFPSVTRELSLKAEVKGVNNCVEKKV